MTELPERLSTMLADRYRLERELGAGGMATVYLAEDLRHDRKVALKVLRPEVAAIIGAQRFLQEIKTTANLQHPHVLGLIDSGTTDGQLWYVMPFVDGESLRDRLNRETQLPVDEAVRLALEVASALDYAHRQGVIHRDIKPENILLQDGRALVADFGIALAASPAQDHSAACRGRDASGAGKAPGRPVRERRRVFRRPGQFQLHLSEGCRWCHPGGALRSTSVVAVGAAAGGHRDHRVPPGMVGTPSAYADTAVQHPAAGAWQVGGRRRVGVGPFPRWHAAGIYRPRLDRPAVPLPAPDRPA